MEISEDSSSLADARSKTLNPITTGTSVVGVKYNGGVMLAADTLVSYGSLARFKNVRRVAQVGEQTVLGSSGEFSDFQYILELVDELNVKDFNNADGRQLDAHELHKYLTRVLYNRRSKFNPLWNSVVVAGVTADGPYLGVADYVGTTYESDSVATGFGGHFAQPLLRKHLEEKEGYQNISKDEAVQYLEESMRVLLYRDCRTINKIVLADVSEGGVQISEPYALETNWAFKGF